MLLGLRSITDQNKNQEKSWFWAEQLIRKTKCKSVFDRWYKYVWMMCMKIFKMRDKCVWNVSDAEHMGIVGTLLHVFSKQKTFAMWPYNGVKSVKSKLIWTGALFSFCSNSLQRLNGASYRAHVLLTISLNASRMHSARSLHTRPGSCKNNSNKWLSTHTTRTIIDNPKRLSCANVVEKFIHSRLVV